MIADRLKKSILQAAIQGKLTEQLPEDGDAKDLLEEIKLEKTQLIKEGKVKKENPLPEIIEDEIPFDVPDNWCWVRLGDVVTVKGGKRIPVGKKLTTVDTGYKYIRVADMHEGTVLDTNVQYVPVDVYPQIRNYTISEDDVYITCAGTIGRIGTIPAKFDGANLTENADKLVFQLLDKEWVALTLASPFVQAQISDCTTKVGQPKLAIKRIQNLVIALPPINEQKRIIAKIKEIFINLSKLENDEIKMATLRKAFPKKMKDSILQSAIQGKLTVQFEADGNAHDLVADIKKKKPLLEITEDEIPFDIPDNWCWVRLGDIGETNIGLTYKPADISIDGTFVLRSGNIQKDKIDYSDSVFVSCDIPESKKCHVGDILICARNGSKRLVGKSAIIYKEGMTFGAFMALYRSPFNEYIHKYINSPYFRSDFDGVSTTTINQITQNNLKERLVPLPPLAEQQRIVERLEQLLPLCDDLE